MPFSLPSPFSITVLLTRASLLALAKSIYYTNAWCSISIVSRAACAVKRTRRVTTESIGIAVMNVVLTLINIWKERKKTLIFADRLLWLTNLEKNSIVCMGCLCFGRLSNVLYHIHIIFDMIWFSDAWRSIFSVSRAARAVIRPVSVITESIGITVMNAGCTLIKGGGRLDFRFFGFGHFLGWFFGFCTKKPRFFGFVVRCSFWCFHFLASGFSFFFFFGKNKAG